MKEIFNKPLCPLVGLGQIFFFVFLSGSQCEGSRRCCNEACEVAPTEIVPYREIVKHVEVVATRWCCVNKAQLVNCNLVRQYYTSDSVAHSSSIMPKILSCIY